MPDPYSAADNATFRLALVAYWQVTPALVAISPAPYADLAPVGYPEDRSYCALSQISSTASERGTRKRAYRQDVYYQFAIYDRDQVRAIEAGATMISWLDRIEDFPLRFGDGYQRAWFWQTERLMAMPAENLRGAKTTWQQAHIYKATLGRYRGFP